MNQDKPMENLETRIGYLKMRLDHTLTHLQTASKMIYLIDGAVLAFAYFLVNTFGLSRGLALFLATLSLILAGINFLHSRFILTQQRWYREIDIRMRELLHERDIPPAPRKKFTKELFTSSHRNLKNIHVWITFWLIGTTVFLFLY